VDNAYWAFLIGSSLTTASASSVTLINPGANNGVFWQVGSSATLGTNSLFLGNILAAESATLTTNAAIQCGRVFALNGAVTLDTNTINALCSSGLNKSYSGGFEFDENGDVGPIASSAVPEPASLALFGMGLLGLRLKKNKMLGMRA